VIVYSTLASPASSWGGRLSYSAWDQAPDGELGNCCSRPRLLHLAAVADGVARPGSAVTTLAFNLLGDVSATHRSSRIALESAFIDTSNG